MKDYLWQLKQREGATRPLGIPKLKTLKLAYKSLHWIMCKIHKNNTLPHLVDMLVLVEAMLSSTTMTSGFLLLSSGVVIFFMRACDPLDMLEAVPDFLVFSLISRRRASQSRLSWSSLSPPISTTAAPFLRLWTRLSSSPISTRLLWSGVYILPFISILVFIKNCHF